MDTLELKWCEECNRLVLESHVHEVPEEMNELFEALFSVNEEEAA